MAHTKGEWVLGLYPQKNYPHRVVMTNDGGAISEVIERADKKEMEANAKLIAAAPNMLKALKEAERFHQEQSPIGVIIREAIKEATK